MSSDEPPLPLFAAFQLSASLMRACVHLCKRFCQAHFIAALDCVHVSLQTSLADVPLRRGLGPVRDDDDPCLSLFEDAVAFLQPRLGGEVGEFGRDGR